MGKSHRFTGERAVGAALTYQGTIVHASFFAAEPGESTGRRDPRMSRAATRRRFMTTDDSDGFTVY